MNEKPREWYKIFVPSTKACLGTLNKEEIQELRKKYVLDIRKIFSSEIEEVFNVYVIRRKKVSIKRQNPMSTYTRKTRDVWELYLDYGQGYEYECSEYSRKEIHARVKEYRENCPQYPIKTLKKRERIEV